MKSQFIFLTGSSAVGKTQLFDAFPTHITRSFKLAHPDGNKSFDDSFKVVKIKMPTREVREALGNPKWEDLKSDKTLARKHQAAIMNRFQGIISSTAETAEPYDHIYLFERAEIDVIGYSYAYDIVSKHNPFIGTLEYTKLKFDYFFVYRPINFDIKYEEIEARPPEGIRVACDRFIEYQLEFKHNHPQSVLYSRASNTDMGVAKIVEKVFS